MEYRKLPHGEEQISILGLGSSSIGMAGEREIQATVELALERGVNFFDLASADAAPFPVYGKAMAGVRDKVYFQIHFGADYHSGTPSSVPSTGSSPPSRPTTSTLAFSTAWTRSPTWSRWQMEACWTTFSSSSGRGRCGTSA